MDNLVFKIDLRGDSAKERLDLQRISQQSGSSDGLMAVEFYFLSAERTGPRITQRIVPLSYSHTGIYGEHTGQLLAKKYMKISDSRMHPSVGSPYLPDHVNAWLKTILPDVEVTAIEDIRLQTSQVKIRNKRTMDFVVKTPIQ